MRRDRRLARALRGVGVAFAMAAQLLGVGPVAAATPQTITFSLPAQGLVGAAVPLTGTASSGLPVSYASETEDTCTVNAQTLTLVDQGTCTVTASQPGDATFDPALDVQASMLVKLPQTISFALPASGVVGAAVALSGTASSGLDVAYVVTTPVICAVAGATLSLLAQGTCGVTATQPGDDAWAPAANVAATMPVALPPWTTADGAFLGGYAFNSAIQTLAIDQDTGITYVGGQFTQVGIRTGAVAKVDPPGSGSDELTGDSPDVVSDQLQLFADDATGYFAVGAIGSVDGDGVHRFGITRMKANGTVDATWHADDPCSTGVLPTWDLGDQLAGFIELSGNVNGLSTMGLVLVDKATGETTFAGDGDGACSSGHRVWGSIPPFGPRTACAGWSICTAHNASLTYNAAEHLLVVETFVYSRQTSNSAFRERRYLVAYDTANGTRPWSRELEHPVVPPDFPPQATWAGVVMTTVVIDGAVVVMGRFPFEQDTSTQSSMLLLDGATGQVLQRWNAAGEQDLVDPSVIVTPASTCLPADLGWTDSAHWRFVQRDSGTALGYASPQALPQGRQVSVCEYGIAGSGAGATLVAEELGTFVAKQAPSLRYDQPRLIHAGRYAVSSNGAFDLQTGNQVAGWDPSPSNVPLTMVSMGGSIVLGGDIVFIHGTAASHVAALDEDLAPIAAFSAELPDTENSSYGIQQVQQLRLLDGALLVAGDLKGDFGRGPVVALDPATGDLIWSHAEELITIGLALAVDEGTGAFYLGAEQFGAGPLLVRFAPNGGGFALDGSFNHTIGAYAGVRFVSALEFIGGRLYIGGHFGSVDGQARQGLARLTNGTLDSWDPMPITELDPDAGDIVEVRPYRFAELGSKVVVAGSFWKIVAIPGGGGGTVHPLSSVLAYSTTTGARVRPVGTNAPWFPDEGVSYDMVVVDDGVYVAFGGTGVGAFDAATLDYLPSRSTRTQPGWGENAVVALGVREPGAAAGLMDGAAAADDGAAGLSAAAAPASLVLGGDLRHWSNVSAGNVVEVLPSDKLTIVRAGNGGGSVTSQPVGLSCGATCTRAFPLDTSVVLTATPVSGATFMGWSGGGCSGTGGCTVQITGPKTVTATFADKAKPVVGAPTTSLRPGAKLSGSSLPLRVSWTASDPGGSGIKRYEISRSTNGGGTWTSVSTSLTTAALNLVAPSSGAVRYRVRAIDKAGNVGTWMAGPNLEPRLVQQSRSSITYAKTWTTVSDSRCSGGSARYAKAAGASASYTFTGRAVGFVTTTASNRGKAQIFVNGVLVSTVDLRSSSRRDRVVAWQMSWSTSASRTIKVVVLGTSGRPRVDLDAFAILR